MIKVLFLLLFVFSEGLCKQIRSIERPDVVIKEDIESGMFWKQYATITHIYNSKSL